MGAGGAQLRAAAAAAGAGALRAGGGSAAAAHRLRDGAGRAAAGAGAPQAAAEPGAPLAATSLQLAGLRGGHPQAVRPEPSITHPSALRNGIVGLLTKSQTCTYTAGEY